jgi:hypothetical protein
MYKWDKEMKKTVLTIIIFFIVPNLFSQNIVSYIRAEFINFDDTLGKDIDTLIYGYNLRMSELENNDEMDWLDARMIIEGIPASEYSGYRVFEVKDIGGLNYTSSKKGCFILFKNNVATKIIYDTIYEPSQLTRILRNIFMVDISTANSSTIIIDRNMVIFEKIRTIRIERINLAGYNYSIIYVY